MRRKRLKTLFIVVTAVFVVTGIDYAAGHNIHKVHAAEINNYFKGKEWIDLSMPFIEKNSIVLYPMHDGKYIRLKIHENGNEFLGIKELEEGIDYTFEDDYLTLNRDSIEKYLNENASGCDFSLNFENNIRRNLTIDYLREGVVTSGIDIDEAKGKRGESVEVPIKICYGGADEVLTQCDFNLKYDTDIFSDVSIKCDDKNGKLNWENDEETGIIHVIYDGYDDSIDDKINSQNINMNLVLKIKEDSPVGDTKIGLENCKVTLSNSETDRVFCLGTRTVIVEN